MSGDLPTGTKGYTWECAACAGAEVDRDRRRREAVAMLAPVAARGLGRRGRIANMRDELAAAVERKNQAVAELVALKRQLSEERAGKQKGGARALLVILGGAPGELVEDVARRRMSELREARQEARENLARIKEGK